NFSFDVNNTSQNTAARTQQLKIYLCPSDSSDGSQIDPGPKGTLPCGKCNYVGNVGTTADPHSTDAAHMGVFNYTVSNGVVTNKVRITDITDGTSSTAMFSETTRAIASVNAGTNNYDITIVYYLPDTDGGWSPLTPMFGPTFNETNA